MDFGGSSGGGLADGSEDHKNKGSPISPAADPPFWAQALRVARGGHAATGLASTAPEAALVLRMILVLLWSSHFWYKVGYNGMGATQHFFTTLGLPGWLAWLDVVIEVTGITMIFLGLWVPLVCVALLPILLSAIVIYLPEGYWFAGGGFEFPLLWVAIQLVSAFMGPGRWSVGQGRARFSTAPRDQPL